MNSQELEAIGLTAQELARKLALYDSQGDLNARLKAVGERLGGAMPLPRRWKSRQEHVPRHRLPVMPAW